MKVDEVQGSSHLLNDQQVTLQAGALGLPFLSCACYRLSHPKTKNACVSHSKFFAREVLNPP